MNFNEYQDWAKTTDTFNVPDSNIKASEPGFVAKILGLVGESGEVAEKFKKVIRDKNGILTEEDKIEIAKELGDVLWYISALSWYMGIPLEDVAKINREKLSKRKAENKLHGAGDNR